MSRRETILLVEDEQIVLEVGQKLLETLGYRVLTARDGREAVQVYATHQDEIDLILLDLVMPQMSGEEALGQLRALNPQVKILLVTGYSLNGLSEEVLHQAEGVLQKPYSIGTLASVLRHCLGCENATDPRLCRTKTDQKRSRNPTKESDIG